MWRVAAMRAVITRRDPFHPVPSCRERVDCRRLCLGRRIGLRLEREVAAVAPESACFGVVSLAIDLNGQARETWAAAYVGACVARAALEEVLHEPLEACQGVC